MSRGLGQQSDAMRAAAARSADALWRTIGSLLDRFSPAECAAYFRH